ncbi:MAG: hypothetical protein ACK5RL_15500 [Acidimicrobiales bacterium]
MGIYLEEHPPAVPQYRAVRRAAVTGAIVLHTAEVPADLTPPDTGAERVASFIASRTTSGSYHSVVDSDSVVRVGRYEWEMFHEGTGGNRWSLGLSFACEAAQWPVLPERWVLGALGRGAAEAANMARWVYATVGVTIPARWISAADYRNGRPGFVGHGQLDPGRRSDPGLGFPWSEFLDAYAAAVRGTLTAGSIMEEYDVPPLAFHQAMADLDQLYLAYRGTLPGDQERRAWARDLAEKMFSKGEPALPTLSYVEWALRGEGAI